MTVCGVCGDCVVCDECVCVVFVVTVFVVFVVTVCCVCGLCGDCMLCLCSDGGAAVRSEAAVAESVPAADPLSVQVLLSAGRGHHPVAGVGSVGRGAERRPPAAHRHRPETSTHDRRRPPADAGWLERSGASGGTGGAQQPRQVRHSVLYIHTTMHHHQCWEGYSGNAIVYRLQVTLFKL